MEKKRIEKVMMGGMEITYEEREDGMLYPVTLEEWAAPLSEMSKYGRMRARYIEEYNPKLKEEMVANLTWWNHLMETDEEAKAMEERLIEQMKEREGVNEQLKRTDWMEYVRRLQNIIYTAQEIVMNELIYS
ncbi:TnpV protein [Howardella ureilytica]